MPELSREEQVDLAWREFQGPDSRHPRKGWLEELFAAHDGVCHYCERKLDLSDRESPIRPTIDHFIPMGKGGADELANCVLACMLCNLAKGDAMPPDLGNLAEKRSEMAHNLRWTDPD